MIQTLNYKVDASAPENMMLLIAPEVMESLYPMTQRLFDGEPIAHVIDFKILELARMKRIACITNHSIP